MQLKDWLILGVALFTWGGVWMYLLRLSALAKRLETELSHREQERELAPSASVVEAEIVASKALTGD